MSEVDTIRGAIKEVIDNLDDRFTGFLYQPTSLEVNQGFARLTSFSRDVAQNFERTWYVVIVLGQDSEYADKTFEEFGEQLAWDLAENEVGYVDEVTQIIIPASGTDGLYAMQAVMRSE